MGAGIVECDVTFTKDLALVCRHAQNDLATTTNILVTPLAAKCIKAFTPATFGPNATLLTPASAECRTSELYPYAGVDGETRAAAEIALQRAEEAARKAADIRWLHEGFEYAARRRAAGVMVIWQADPNFNNEQHLADSRSWDAYADYVNALRNETIGFRGQVALVHGDSHYFKLDKPLNGPAGEVLANFTRVETFGARNTHWVSATIDESDPSLFVFEPRIVAANAH